MPEEKKIYVDEDWKTRVEAEKEAQRAKPAEPEAAGDRGPAEPGATKMPPASFEMLLTTLATEAMVALGQIPHPATGKPELNLDQAKYFIDTVDVLQQKTKGNLTPTEAQSLEDLLHQLRMAFVAMQQQGTRSSSST